MSSRQRKRRGGAVDSSRPRKRSRLLPSSAGGTSQAELLDLEGSGTLSFEPAGGEVIDLMVASSEREIIIISDDESAVDREQSQQQPHLSGASENSAEPLARDDEEEPRENDGAWPAGPARPPAREDDNSEVQDREQSQQYPLGSGEAENSAELWASDNEEEPSDNDGSAPSSEWTASLISPLTWEDDNSEDSEQSSKYSFGSISSDTSSETLPRFLNLEPGDTEFSAPSSEWPGGLVSPPTWEDDNSELLQEHEQERRNVTPNRQEQVDGSGNGTGANDAPVAEAAPAEQGAEEEDTASSRAQQGVVIRCPICLEFYSQIMKRGRKLVATTCGHVFCNECLPIAVESTGTCPTCQKGLICLRKLYHPVYF